MKHFATRNFLFPRAEQSVSRRGTLCFGAANTLFYPISSISEGKENGMKPCLLFMPLLLPCRWQIK